MLAQSHGNEKRQWLAPEREGFNGCCIEHARPPPGVKCSVASTRNVGGKKGNERDRLKPTPKGSWPLAALQRVQTHAFMRI